MILVDRWRGIDRRCTAGEIGGARREGRRPAGCDVDNKLSLTVAQYKALGTVALMPEDAVTLVDSNAALADGADGCRASARLAGKGVDRLDATDDTLSLSGGAIQGAGHGGADGERRGDSWSTRGAASGRHRG